MEIITINRGDADYPERLSHLDSPPTTLYVRGRPLQEVLERQAVAIVGSRNLTPYGKQVTYDFAYKLAEQGVVIISGLAFGVDATAHKAALDAGGTTIAVLPSSLHNVYPKGNRLIAQRILDNGGLLVSEYETGGVAYKSYFIARNRIVAGLANVVLITEAGKGSGALYTAGFARDAGQTLYAIPGMITAPRSYGTNHLLKNGALAVTEVEDVLTGLNLKPHKNTLRHIRGSNPNEQAIIDLLLKGVYEGDELLEQSLLTASHFNQSLTMLEIGNKVKALGANRWGLV